MPLSSLTNITLFNTFSADSDIEIELELFVNKTTATKLNSGEDKIEDILVLHLDRGKDYFLSVSGNYLPSCFGSPIHTLCYMRQPILDLPLETVSELVSDMATCGTELQHSQSNKLLLCLPPLGFKSSLAGLGIELSTTAPAWQAWFCIQSLVPKK